MGNVSGNTATFAVVVVPAGAKGLTGTAALAEFRFNGRDGRGESVEAEGALTVLFTGEADQAPSCAGATTTPPPTTNPPATTP